MERVEEVDDVVCDFMVERTMHSTIIGPKGNNIRRLSADTGVRIHIPKVKRKQDEMSRGKGADRWCEKKARC